MSARAAASLFAFAFAVIVAFGLLALNSWLGDVLAATWAFVVFPAAALHVTRRAIRSSGGEDRGPDYWRTSNWGAGAQR